MDADPWLKTPRFPPMGGRPTGASPTVMVATTWLVEGSIRETELSPYWATQTPWLSTATVIGFLPTAMVAVTFPVVTSIRETALLLRLATHRLPSP